MLDPHCLFIYSLYNRVSSFSTLTASPAQQTLKQPYNHTPKNTHKMNLLPILPLILPFLPSTTAAPVTTPFNLVTFSPNTAHNNLYLSTQSTGPLNSNPVFRDPANAATFSLANTTVHYEAPNKAPWALALVNGDVVQGNVEVSVSPSAASAVSTGFEIAEDGLLGVDSSRWGGWLGKSFYSFLLAS